jgi:hypothetical protein
VSVALKGECHENIQKILNTYGTRFIAITTDPTLGHTQSQENSAKINKNRNMFQYHPRTYGSVSQASSFLFSFNPG